MTTSHAKSASMIQRKKYEDRTIHLNQVLRTISSINQLIVREKDEQKLVQKACELLIETRGYLGAWIAIGDLKSPPSIIAHSGDKEKFRALHEFAERGKMASMQRDSSFFRRRSHSDRPRGILRKLFALGRTRT